MSFSSFPRLLFLAAGFLLALLCASPHASAQAVEFFGTLSVNHLSQVPTGYLTAKGAEQEQFTSMTPVGMAGGVDLRLFSGAGVRVAAEARGATRPGLTGSMDNALFALKIGAHAPVLHVKPYVEGGAGFMSAHTANVSDAASARMTTTGSFASHFDIVEGFAGVDYPVGRFVDLRLIEVGAGSSMGATPNTSIFSVNTGVVLHF